MSEETKEEIKESAVEESQFVEPKVDFEGSEEQVEKEPLKESSGQESKEETSEDKTKEPKEVNFQDFLKDRGVEFKQILEEKAEEKTEKEEVKAKKPFIPRVLDDLPEEDRPIFKNMSIESFSKLKPIYLEYKALKQENEALKQSKAKDSASVYGHPKAFALTKEYDTHVRDYNLADQIKSHWALQAAKVSRGEKWQDIDLDPKTGKLIVSEAKDSNAEAEAYIGDQLQFAREQHFEAGKGLKSYIDSYGKGYEADLQVIKGAIEKYFPGYTAENHPTKDIQKAVINALPATFRDNPVSQLLAMTAANNAILMGKLKKATDELNKLKGIKSDASAAQPRKGEFLNDKSANTGVKFSDFAARRAAD